MLLTTISFIPHLQPSEPSLLSSSHSHGSSNFYVKILISRILGVALSKSKLSHFYLHSVVENVDVSVQSNSITSDVCISYSGFFCFTLFYEGL